MSTRCCPPSVESASATISDDKEHLTLRKVEPAMLLSSDIDSKDELVLFSAQGNALARRSVDVSDRRHPVESTITATAAKQKVENKASLIPGLDYNALCQQIMHWKTVLSSYPPHIVQELDPVLVPAACTCQSSMIVAMLDIPAWG